MSAVELMKTETVYTEAWNKLRPHPRPLRRPAVPHRVISGAHGGL